MEFLRDVPTEAALEDLASARADIEIARAQGDDRALVRALGRAGEAARVSRLGAAARAFLEDAVALARRLELPRFEVANAIRLGTAVLYEGDAPGAERLLRDALARARAIGTFEDFALQHLGKCLAERGQMAEAIECFERALALRERGGDPGLVSSSRRALARARELAGE